MVDPSATTAQLRVGATLWDWQVGWLVVTKITRPEDLGALTDGTWRRGSNAERCALHGGSTRRQVFQVRD